MANYKRCDRCKKSTEQEKNMTVRSVVIKQDCIYYGSVDLCGDCFEKLKKWICGIID